MRIPDTVTIRGHTWTVRCVPNLFRDKKAYGLCFGDKEDRIILIDSSQTQEDQESTLIHELLHALFSYNDLKGLVGEKVEEQIVGGLERGLYELLKQIGA